MATSTVSHECSQTSEQMGTGFPFMQLPLEIRRHVYHLLLPRWDTSYDPTNFALNPPKLPNKCLNVLVANRQISSEARQVLSGLNTFTIEIGYDQVHFLSQWEDFWRVPASLFMSWFPYIKMWELDIMFQDPWLRKRSSCDGQRFPRSIFECHDNTQGYFAEEETIFTVVDQLVEIKDLQSLRITFPCLCRRSELQEPSNEIYSHRLLSLLGHLKRLHVQKSLKFIAAQPDFERGSHMFIRTQNQQCQQTNCLQLVASFDDLKSFLTGTSPRRHILLQERKWLTIRPRFALTDLAMGDIQVNSSSPLLMPLWKSLQECRQASLEDQEPTDELKQRFNECYEEVSQHFDSLTRL
ncbi:MAG: hypothetical protein Q9169_001362 [Polycauliona sp. 2 TL-2023]